MRLVTFGCLCVMFGSVLGCGDPLPGRSAGAPEMIDAPKNQDTMPSTGVASPPPDTDRDGILDSADSCPGTDQGKQVDATGCGIDPDDDGVIGQIDLCPDSPYGEPVDATGCRPRMAVPQEYTLLLTFKKASAKINGDPRAALAEVAALMTQYPETTVLIEGHTDDRGHASYNVKLSKRRSDAVAAVLVTDLGFEAARISSKGFGETKPIATNATKEGRARNRRVVAVVSPGRAPMSAVEAAAGDPSTAMQ